MNRLPLLADRLRDKRRDEFVGRDAETAEFGAMLESAPTSPTILYLYGPGGIGKSTLLRHYAEMAEAHDRPVIELKGGNIGLSVAEFVRAGVVIHRDPATVLLVDAVEDCQALMPWLQDSFLPALPAKALVVIAGRYAPEPNWATAPGWDQVLKVRPLGSLSAQEARRLLTARGVPHTRRASLLRFASGHPLALCLAARQPDIDGPARQSLVDTLMPYLLDVDVPSAAHRQALEVCARAHATTEELLRTVLPEHDAAALFAWLRRRPFTTLGKFGLVPHDLVREVLSADLRWRDPAEFAKTHRRLREYALARVHNASAATALREAAALRHLYRDSGTTDFQHQWHREGEVVEGPCQQHDHQEVLRLALLTGEQQLVAWWLDKQPAAFRVYRNAATDEMTGFTAWLQISDPDSEDLTDPVVACSWQHTQSTRPLGQNEKLGLARFVVCVPDHLSTSPTWDLMHWRMLAEALRGDRREWNFIVAGPGKPWVELMIENGFAKVGELEVTGTRRSVLYAHDWRSSPVEHWLKCADHRLLGGLPLPEPVMLGRARFDKAVRDALRSLRRPTALAGSPLLDTSLLTGQSGMRAEDELRSVLITAIDDLAADPRSDKAHRALAATFVAGAPTKEAAAMRVGMPFSTYRRHLASGLEQLCDSLWHKANQPISSLARTGL